MKEIKKGLTGDFSGSFTARNDHQVNVSSDFNTTLKSHKKEVAFKLAKNGTSDFNEEVDRSPMIGGAGARKYYDDDKSISDAASSLGSINN